MSAWYVLYVVSGTGSMYLAPMELEWRSTQVTTIMYVMPQVQLESVGSSVTTAFGTDAVHAWCLDHGNCTCGTPL